MTAAVPNSMPTRFYLLLALFFGFGLCAPSPSLAQLKKPEELAYTLAIAQLDKGDTKAAIPLLRQAARPKASNQYANQATLLLAQAFIRQGKPDSALARLTGLHSREPNWQGAHLTQRLRSHLYFAKSRFASGTSTASGAGLPPDSLLALLKSGLAKAPTDTLLVLAKQHPDFDAIGQLLTNRGAPTDQREAKSSALATQGFRIALVLPLQLQNIGSASDALSEWYAGAQVAQALLAKEGNLIDINVFDTKRSLDTLKAILASGSLRAQHLIVGPIYSQGTIELAEYAASARIPLLNPLSNQLRWPASNPMAYNAEPSFADLAQAAWDAVPKPNRVAILYGTSAKDTTLAELYKGLATSHSVPIAVYKQVAKNSAANMPKFIAEAKLDSASVLFVPNAESLVKAQLLSALEVTKSRAKVIAYGELLETADWDWTELERRRIRFLYPDYIAQESPQAGKVAAAIKALTGRPATYIGLRAFDLITALVNSVKANGYSPNFLREHSPFRAPLSSGYDFSQQHSNAKVPVYIVSDGQLIR